MDSVAYAKTLFDEVEFTPEDGTRTEPDFLLEICRAAVEQGARIINLPDTVGCSTPDEMFGLMSACERRPFAI